MASADRHRMKFAHKNATVRKDKMNSKIALRRTLTVLLTVLMTGCCSTKLINRANQTVTDTFSPIAVYRLPNGPLFALEGELHPADSTVNKGNVHTFLITSRTNLGAEPFPTDGRLALERIQKLPENQIARHSKLMAHLPLGFERVVDLLTNNVLIAGREHHPGRAYLLFLPLTLSVDVPMFPLRLVLTIITIPMMAC